jgi:hypothetical protein
MLRLVRISVRAVRAAATMAAVLCAAWAPAHARSASVPASFAHRPTFDSTALAAALPSVLSPPMVQPGSRLVSMIAEDIDADGDLDVVANDGSLDLIVWTNDGSGRLSRQPGRDAPGVRSEPDAPGLTHGPPSPDSVVPQAFGSLDIHPRSMAASPDRSPLSFASSADALRPVFISTRTPRGPPVSAFLI